MADELLPYYEKELAFIRQMGAEFAKEHPKIAGRLGVNAETIEDPHVSRLIESFAYLNARVQHKLDDDFPEITDALFNIIFPHYLRPIPSMSIVQFVPDKEQLDCTHDVARRTLVETEHFQGESCQFTTTYPVKLQPINVTHASLTGRPFTTPGAESVRGASSVLKISLKTFTPDIPMSELDLSSIRFYLKGQAQHIHPLYQMLLSSVKGIAVSTPEASTHPCYLNKDAIKEAGFAEDDGCLPYPKQSFIGYRLLTEYFAFPEKFMFVDINRLNNALPQGATDAIDIFIYFSEADIELEHNITEDNFLLGCTPAINLFDVKTDPIKLDQTQPEYQVVPDSRRPLGYEVYSVNSVISSTSTGDKEEFLPFYGLKHRHQSDDQHAFWIANRRKAKMDFHNRDNGTDIYLSLMNLNFDPNVPADRTLHIETTCSNRDLPSKLPFNSEHPKLQCVESSPPCERIRCVTQPTRTIRPPLRNQARWRLISHLNLNHLSITGGGNAAESLREMLRLYDFTESSITRALIDSILHVDSKAISSPLNIDGTATMCRGIEITVTLDSTLLSGSSSYLYASILEHFFALYCTINSFTRVLIKLDKKEGYLKKCPPRAGEKALL